MIISKDKFQEERCKTIDTQYERYKWVNTKFDKIVKQRISLLPAIGELHQDAVGSFWSGFFTSAILGIAASIETTLRAITDLSQLKRRDKKDWINVIEEAKKQMIISSELCDRIQYFRETIRNRITHSGKLTEIFGWKKEGQKQHSLSDERLDLIARFTKESKSFRVSPDYEFGKPIRTESVPFLSKEILAMDGITYIISKIFSYQF